MRAREIPTAWCAINSATRRTPALKRIDSVLHGVFEPRALYRSSCSLFGLSQARLRWPPIASTHSVGRLPLDRTTVTVRPSSTHALPRVYLHPAQLHIHTRFSLAPPPDLAALPSGQGKSLNTDACREEEVQSQCKPPFIAVHAENLDTNARRNADPTA